MARARWRGRRLPVTLASFFLALTCAAVAIRCLAPASVTVAPAVHTAFHTQYDRYVPMPSLPTIDSLDRYTLVWSDEFDTGPGRHPPSADHWTHETGCGTHNNELQCYTAANNSYVADGRLHIVARREDTVVGTVIDTNVTVPINGTNTTMMVTRHETHYQRYHYTSARLTTQHRHATNYPRIQARIKLPSFVGAWPAFWMIGSAIDSVGWPRCGEIDVVELVNEEGIVHSTIHFDGNSDSDDNDTNGDSVPYQHSQLTGSHLPAHPEFPHDGFHVYELVHTASHLLFLFDSQLYYIVPIHSNAVLRATFSSEDNPFFVVLNLAVGGDWPQWKVDDNALQAAMLVDWIRVYQHTDDLKGHGQRHPRTART